MRTLCLAIALLAATLAPLAAASAPEASCIPTSGGLDYHSYLCLDPANPRCAAYTLHHNDWDGVKKTCYPGP